jgi:P-type conjugative transfer protein TrbJ
MSLNAKKTVNKPQFAIKGFIYACFRKKEVKLTESFRKLVTLQVSLVCLGATLPAHAGGLPVIDTVNLQQNAVSAVEGINQTMKMIQQYQLQLQQYENMIQNTLAPAAYVWNKVEQVNYQLLGAMNTLNYYRSQAGNLDGYLYKRIAPD